MKLENLVLRYDGILDKDISQIRKLIDNLPLVIESTPLADQNTIAVSLSANNVPIYSFFPEQGRVSYYGLEKINSRLFTIKYDTEYESNTKINKSVLIISSIKPRVDFKFYCTKKIS